MKKSYIIPKTLVSTLDVQPLMAGSELGVGSGTVDASASLSRKNRVWDEEEEYGDDEIDY